jgi:hypothetical protein
VSDFSSLTSISASGRWSAMWNATVLIMPCVVKSSSFSGSRAYRFCRLNSASLSKFPNVLSKNLRTGILQFSVFVSMF